MGQLVANCQIAVRMTPDGKQSIIRSDFESLAHSPEAKEASLQGLIQQIQTRENDETTDRNAFFGGEITRRLQHYRQCVQILEEIHRYYHDRLDLVRDESAVVAAYLLFGKVIRLLKMACLCLEHHFWETLLLLRPIDEAVHLAEYFICAENTEPGAKDLKKWFRMNWSPKDQTCRQAIGRYLDSMTGETSVQTSAELISELYGKKSKELHHTYNGIWEIHRAKLDSNGRPVSIGIDYGPCSYTRKVLEITEFFQASIWTALQSFLLCFKERLSLEQNHIARLMNLNQFFLCQSQ
ncbi:MAG TPA: hypothetical protein VJM82_00005 [Nitrospiraceae bacterium]|nr:hypothetical protein [Nitrospiraceae bacterium]